MTMDETPQTELPDDLREHWKITITQSPKTNKSGPLTLDFYKDGVISGGKTDHVEAWGNSWNESLNLAIQAARNYMVERTSEQR
jgi:hypothetical protein